MDTWKYGNLSLAVWFISLTLGVFLSFLFPIVLAPLSFIPVQINLFTIFGTLGFLVQLFTVHLFSFYGQSNESQFDLFAACTFTTFLLFLLESTNPVGLIYLLIIFFATNLLERGHPNWLNTLKNKIWKKS